MIKPLWVSPLFFVVFILMKMMAQSHHLQQLLLLLMLKHYNHKCKFTLRDILNINGVFDVVFEVFYNSIFFNN